MGFKDNWKKLVGWWAENAMYNQKKLSAGFSWVLVVIIGALTVPLIATVQGEVPNWPAFTVVVIGTIAGFLIMLVESVFGKKEAPSTGTIVAAPIDLEPKPA